jgi:TetR/AcrR family transcriptional regulator, fatty acid metabolism regulator protein
MPKNKDKILDAAENLMGRNGIADTTIAKVAQKAEVADSLVYKYFKNKEDLLFSIAFRRLEEALIQFNEALQGIKDPASRLGKMIWYSLRYNDLHPGYTRILLFECRSNARFYNTKAYQLLRRHAGITTGIFLDGIKEGVFKKDLNLRLARDLVYGVLDFEAISSIATNEVDISIEDFDHIMDLIVPMVSKEETSHEPQVRDRLLLSAEKIMARDGFSKAKISDIADSAQTAEGTIYEYFKNKEDLLLSIPKKRFQQHINNLQKTFKVTTSPEKMERLLRDHFTMYLVNRDFLKVFLLDMQLNVQFYNSEPYAIFQRYLTFIEDVVREGMEEGAFRPDVNTRVFRNMFLGAFTHMALRWIIVKRREPFDKMMEINDLIRLLMASLS